jgi:RNA recognition motif-containing protein
MGRKLYCGNLSYSVTSDGLRAIFEAHGKVDSAEVIMDRSTGQSKGFGFVEMGTDQEAQKAISALNGQDNDGRKLTVNEAKPREPRTGGGFKSGGFSGGGRGNRY